MTVPTILCVVINYIIMSMKHLRDHIPSSCVVLMMHNIMVNGRQHSAYSPTSHVDAGASVREMESEISLTVTRFDT